MSYKFRLCLSHKCNLKVQSIPNRFRFLEHETTDDNEMKITKLVHQEFIKKGKGCRVSFHSARNFGFGLWITDTFPFKCEIIVIFETELIWRDALECCISFTMHLLIECCKHDLTVLGS